VYAINGATGTLIWCKKNVVAYHIKKNPAQKNSFICVGLPENSDNLIGNYIFNINANGRISQPVKFSNYYSPQLSMYFNGNEVLINTEEYLYSINQNKKLDSSDRRVLYKQIDTWSNQEYDENRNTSGMLFSNKSFYYKNHGKCIFNLVQYDKKDYKKGFLEIISLKDKKIVDRLYLPHDSEMPPSIEDINKDGKLDVLINCRDGNLYCYNLGIRAD
jgi:hypothetical protein